MIQLGYDLAEKHSRK